MAAIETLRLTRRFGRHLAVDRVSMTVPDKAVYGFLGRNGAGKTTTLKMLLGLIRPTEGRAMIGGLDIGRDRVAASRRVGALLEAQGFYGNLTGRENLQLTRSLLDLPADPLLAGDEVVAQVVSGALRSTAEPVQFLLQPRPAPVLGRHHVQPAARLQRP